ncbi:GLE1-like domain-containing [Cryptosporidium sp. chipmunk genotype I]|uniref:GLE1-like domain-containing n=1 Tax=Cryptosporidium sp. chipmunk genotype I TaxID=1280935 RepID=UPI003519E2FC|nr:GLE1-like domain-containing [Cryptosporidium sp. chipmunk genotype I]
MDGEKLSQNLNYLVFSWEAKYARNDKVFKEKVSPIMKHDWNYEKAEQDEDTISPIINRHIQEIEEEIQRINKEDEDKKKKEEEERKEKERKEREEREQEELKLRKEQEELRLKKEKEQEELRFKKERDELRLKKEKEQKEERQKAQVEAKGKELNPSLNNSTNEVNFETQGKAYIEKISNYQNSNEYKEIISSTESSIKSTRTNVKKTIQLSINQISSTHQQILSSSRRIKELLSGLRSSSTSIIASSESPSPMYSYGLYMVASLFIDQCWTQISAFPDSVWSYAYSCVHILDENDEFEAFLEGLILTECRVLYSSNLEDLKKRENETEESFGKRLNSIVRFYLSINILRGNFGKIWLWLVKLLNRESPHRLFVFVALAVIQIVPHFFFSQFKNQFMKIIDYILRFKLPQIYALIEGNPFPIKGQCKQLEAILSDLKSSCNTPPPSGFILKDKHLDVEC